jgi:hypothetical protein
VTLMRAAIRRFLCTAALARYTCPTQPIRRLQFLASNRNLCDIAIGYSLLLALPFQPLTRRTD